MLFLNPTTPQKNKKSKKEGSSHIPPPVAVGGVHFKIQDLPKYDMSEATAEDELEYGVTGKGGVALPFACRLHKCLEAVEAEGLTHVISWLPHGRAFIVHDPSLFVELVLPRFFNQSRYASFQRQLNIYGFRRFIDGQDKGAYFHLCFVREERSLVRHMVRSKIKNNKHLPRKKGPSAAFYNFYHPAWKNHSTSKEPWRTIPHQLYSNTGEQPQPSLEQQDPQLVQKQPQQVEKAMHKSSGDDLPRADKSHLDVVISTNPNDPNAVAIEDASDSAFSRELDEMINSSNSCIDNFESLDSLAFFDEGNTFHWKEEWTANQTGTSHTPTEEGEVCDPFDLEPTQLASAFRHAKRSSTMTVETKQVSSSTL